MTDEVVAQLRLRYPALRYFEYAHLPDHLASVSRPFHDLAWEMAEKLPYGAEASAGLRKLLESKDCMVRAALDAREAT